MRKHLYCTHDGRTKKQMVLKPCPLRFEGALFGIYNLYMGVRWLCNPYMGMCGVKARYFLVLFYLGLKGIQQIAKHFWGPRTSCNKLTHEARAAWTSFQGGCQRFGSKVFSGVGDTFFKNKPLSQPFGLYFPLGPSLYGCCWEPFYIFVYCGQLQNSFLLLPFQREPS